MERLIALGLLSLGALCAQAATAATAEATPKPDAVATAEALSVDPSLFTTQTFEWNDAARHRAVPAKLYLPVGPLKAGAVPMVVFSHGIGGSKDGYSYLGRYFAAHGYASLHVQHVGSDRQIWLGNPLSIVSRLSDAAQETEALNRVKDIKFALDHILAEPVGSVINAQRLVAAGHSYGANTTMLLAGAKVELKGTAVSAKDPRFTAAISDLCTAVLWPGRSAQNLCRALTYPRCTSPPRRTTFKSPATTPAWPTGWRCTRRPASPRTLPRCWPCSRMVRTASSPTAWARGVWRLNPKVKVATRQLAVAFLNWLQAKDAGSLEQWSGQNAAILARFEKSVL